MKRFVRIPAWFLSFLPGLLSAGGQEFVAVSGMNLFLNGKPYYYSGANYWYGMNLASKGTGGDRVRLDRELNFLTEMGLRNLRVMAGTEGPDTEPQRIVPPLQISPGVYDADLLDGLDYLLYSMGKHGLRAVMCLNNYWQWSGGMAQYVRWNGGIPISYQYGSFIRYAAGFYDNVGAMADFDDHIRFITGRVNPYTGRAYRDDPAIMAWELANEPRSYGNTASLDRWIDDTANLIHSLDANHLVTTGAEGLSDFQTNHDGAGIDYATIHIWAQNWGWYNPGNPSGTFANAETKARTFFNERAAAAKTLNKPMVLEEFGLARDNGSTNPASTTGWKDRLYGVFFDLVYQSASSGGPACGDNFWAWAGEGRPKTPYGSAWLSGDAWIGDPPHESQGWYGVYDGDSTTIAVVSTHAERMNQLAGVTEVAHRQAAIRSGLALQAYPSSFMEKITFSAEVQSKSGNASLEIFDILGRRILSIQVQGGRFNRTLTRSDFALLGASSGIYVARLSSGDDFAQARFIWLK